MFWGGAVVRSARRFRFLDVSANCQSGKAAVARPAGWHRSAEVCASADGIGARDRPDTPIPRQHAAGIVVQNLNIAVPVGPRTPRLSIGQPAPPDFDEKAAFFPLWEHCSPAVTGRTIARASWITATVRQAWIRDVVKRGGDPAFDEKREKQETDDLFPWKPEPLPRTAQSLPHDLRPRIRDNAIAPLMPTSTAWSAREIGS